MIFIILGFFIGFIVGLLDIDEVDILYVFFSGSIGLWVGFFLYIGVGGAIGYCLPTMEVIEEHEICALNDATSIEGANYLFSGSTDEEFVYRYVINTEKGKRIEEESADNVYIHDGNYTPKIVIHRKTLKKDWYYWFANDLFIEDYYVEFFVPKNTITNEYNIDLK